MVILFDRGYLDHFAYVSKERYDSFLQSTKTDLDAVRDERYDMVVHMVTAANGAPSHYTLENNAARSEGIELAIELDNKIKGVWNGHPNHVYFHFM